MVKYNFREICVVPSADSFVDVMLSKTNRQTPTIVRARWKISRIRQFYMRKVRFTQHNFVERLSKTVEQFPKLDAIHPFYADLINVLYDRDHYKLALGQLNIARQIVNNIGNDYIKLLKYGDSLYRCKQLKRAALGRMVKVVRQQKSALAYLEQIRQHLSRLPSIDPHTRTLLLTGFPNVGKSSFINIITRADVEVQNYPFTTKSLYVGHCDYEYLRWQIIDSPGILDRPLEERNTIEMQAITALAHLNACVVFFIDLSPLCQYPIAQQCALFHSLAPLFHNKPTVVVANKTDLRSVSELDSEERGLIEELKRRYKNVELHEMSNVTQSGVMSVRNKACDMLLSHRVEVKAQTKKLSAIENRLFVANPQKRDNKERQSNIPQSVLEERELIRRGLKVKTDESAKDRVSARDLEEKKGGPGVFAYDTRQHWQLGNDEWKYDPIPEIYNGKNIADFYSADVGQRLDKLESEESQRLAAESEQTATAANDVDMDNNDNNSDLDDDDRLLYRYIHRKQTLARVDHSHLKSIRNSRAFVERRDQKIPLKQMTESLQDLGIRTGRVSRRVAFESEQENKKMEPSAATATSRDVQAISRSQSRPRNAAERSRSKSRNRSRTPAAKGITSMAATKMAHQLKQKAIKSIQREGRRHESDRAILDTKPKHLFSGKRNIHKADWR